MLVLQIQPDEGISLQFGAKMPGPEMHLGAVRMDFNYRDYFHTEPSTGYETLLYDCMIGDATLFQRADSVEAGWAAVQPMLDLWQNDPTAPLEFYPAGTAGPDAAEHCCCATAASGARSRDDARQPLTPASPRMRGEAE